MSVQLEFCAFVTQSRERTPPGARSQPWRNVGAGASAPAAAVFPPEYDTGWIKEHGRLTRWRIQTVGVSPEEIGLCGCWLLILVERWQQLVRRGRVIRESVEYAGYCSSVAPGQYPAEQLLGFIRGHGAAMENGSHYRRV